MQDQFESLAKRLAARTQELRASEPARPPLKLVTTTTASALQMDSVVRESHLRMIRSLARSYRGVGLQLLVDQATLGRAGLDDLGDEEVLQLHRDLDRARECIRDGVDFEEAGLLRAFS